MTHRQVVSGFQSQQKAVLSRHLICKPRIFGKYERASSFQLCNVVLVRWEFFSFLGCLFRSISLYIPQFYRWVRQVDTRTQSLTLKWYLLKLRLEEVHWELQKSVNKKYISHLLVIRAANKRLSSDNDRLVIHSIHRCSFAFESVNKSFVRCR